MSDDELRSALIEIHRWEMISGPHSIGLANLETWVTAYTQGILVPSEAHHGEPTGVIPS